MDLDSPNHPRSRDNSWKIRRRFSRPVTDSSRVLRLCPPSARVRETTRVSVAGRSLFFFFGRARCNPLFHETNSRVKALENFSWTSVNFRGNSASTVYARISFSLLSKTINTRRSRYVTGNQIGQERFLSNIKFVDLKYLI